MSYFLSALFTFQALAAVLLVVAIFFGVFVLVMKTWNYFISSGLIATVLISLGVSVVLIALAVPSVAALIGTSCHLNETFCGDDE